MSRFAIRDDDTSFFTRPEDLDFVYGRYWGTVPISLAVVPFSVPVHRGRSHSAVHAPDQQVPLGENVALVDYLKEKIALGQVEIMLHGYSHEYKQINGKWVGEFGWKPQSQLMREIVEGKGYLERLLKVRIRVFVPPSNTIGASGIRAIRAAGLNLSGIMGRGGDRPFSADYPTAWLKRWAWRLRRGAPYPYPLRYGGHTELCAHALTPRANRDKLLQALNESVAHHWPYVLTTHYWEFRDDVSMHATLAGLIGCAEKLNMTFASVSQCIGDADEIR